MILTASSTCTFYIALSAPPSHRLHEKTTYLCFSPVVMAIDLFALAPFGLSECVYLFMPHWIFNYRISDQVFFREKPKVYFDCFSTLFGHFRRALFKNRKKAQKKINIIYLQARIKWYYHSFHIPKPAKPKQHSEHIYFPLVGGDDVLCGP